MKYILNLPKWAKVVGLSGVAASLVGIAALIVQKIRRSEYKLTAEEIRRSVDSSEAYEAAWKKLMDLRR